MARELLMTKEFVDALVRARVVSADDLTRIAAITIRVVPGDPVMVSVDYFAERSLLNAIAEGQVASDG